MITLHWLPQSQIMYIFVVVKNSNNSRAILIVHQFEYSHQVYRWPLFPIETLQWC